MKRLLGLLVVTASVACHQAQTDSTAVSSATAPPSPSPSVDASASPVARANATATPPPTTTNDDDDGKDESDDGPSPDGTAWAIADAALVKRVDEIVTKAIADLHVPAISITIVRDKHVVVQKGYGFADVDAKAPYTKDTISGVASETKIFTAVAVLQLVEQKKLSLSDPFTKYVKGCPPIWDAITIRQLLAMQSGIPRLKGIPWKDGIAGAAKMPLLFPPGTKTDYSNTNFNLLGEVIEAASGKSYSDYLAAHVFAPLKMTSTRLHSQSDPATMAVGYEWKNGAIGRAPPIGPDGYAAGGLISNQVDMTLFDGGLASGALLTKASSDELVAVQPLTDKKGTRGLGWDSVRVVKGRRRVTKGGDTSGYKAFYARAVDEGVSVILLANNDVKKLNKVGHSIFTDALERK